VSLRTTRRENTLTTAGAAFLTMGAKERRIASRLVGAWRVSPAAGSAAASSSRISALRIMTRHSREGASARPAQRAAPDAGARPQAGTADRRCLVLDGLFD